MSQFGGTVHSTGEIKFGLRHRYCHHCLPPPRNCTGKKASVSGERFGTSGKLQGGFRPHQPSCRRRQSGNKRATAVCEDSVLIKLISSLPVWCFFTTSANFRNARHAVYRKRSRSRPTSKISLHRNISGNVGRSNTFVIQSVRTPLYVPKVRTDFIDLSTQSRAVEAQSLTDRNLAPVPQSECSRTTTAEL